ncbi:MAG: cupin domain-containing protein [Thermoplasmata archaeon]|uniref:Cupin domain-containing protein n=1 Tax=Candidatus Sysuiplasma superficiale TaxID=2823368 RepID=A0A8J7YP52_9ARCH|nr:cupin domain-containing protein [Candidatus Sysuiplasma superficiale]MBX8643950.1 cupin domain-containing protein [Candidatus Sysuiplasma superficiale]MCL4346297.1 cupin domain-containing protein [Candidatus Thermoplasmatota archaeon]
MELQGKHWDSVKKERVSDLIDRQLVYGEKVMVARLFIRKGCVVPAHHHENEQITWIMKGALEFEIDGKKFAVREGETLVIPSNKIHKAVALEDTVDIDVFSPPRQDWITGKDDYLRTGARVETK